MENLTETRQEILDFLQTDEYITGSNYGHGNGHGPGDDFGSGYSSSYGHGPGYGSIYGDGYGDGYGSSNSDGAGGYCSANDINIEAFNGMLIHKIDCVPTLIDSVHGNFAKGRILNSDLTTILCYIAKYDNYFAHGNTIKDAFRDAKQKYINKCPLKKHITRFNEQYPDRNKKVPAKELFDWHYVLTNSCLAGRKYFCEKHHLDYKNGEYTVNEFIELTKNAYRGDIIKQL